MASAFTRRQVLTATTASLLAAAAPRLVVGQPSAALAVTDLGSDLALISGAGANVVALAKADGVLLVDGGAAQHSAALQRVLARALARPARRDSVQQQLARRAHGRERGAACGGRHRHGAREHEALARRRLSSSSGRAGTTRRVLPRSCRTRRSTSRATSSSAAGASSTGTCRARTPTATSPSTFGDANVLVASDLLVGRPLSRARLLDGRLDRRARRRDARRCSSATDARTRVVAANGGVYGRAELEAQLAMLTAVRQQDRRSVSRRHEPRGFHRGEADGGVRRTVGRPAAVLAARLQRRVRAHARARWSHLMPFSTVARQS